MTFIPRLRTAAESNAGVECCSNEAHLCARCQEDHVGQVGAEKRGPYADGLKLLRAAAETPESTFEAAWKARRLRDLAAEPEQVATLRAAHGMPEEPARLTAEELKAYAPPSSYAEGIKALQSQLKEAR